MRFYHLIVWVHLLAAFVWIGGMFFLALVGAPSLRTLEPADLRRRVFDDLGRRFRVVGWIAVSVLLITGLVNLHLRGLLTMTTLGSADFWKAPYGTALLWKLVFVAALVGVEALHDFVLGPMATRTPADAAGSRRLTRGAALLARGAVLLALPLLYFAVRLARGGG